MKNARGHKTKNKAGISHFSCSVRDFRFTTTLLFLIFSSWLTAQPGLRIYADAGKNNASGSLFIKSAALANYEFGKNRIETGFQIDIKNNSNSVFSGYNVNASREHAFGGYLFHMQGFYTRTSYSEILGETNWGALLDMRHKRFDIAIGTNFRTYSFKSGAISEYRIKRDASKFHENFNMMYSIGYSIKPTDEVWNAGLEITNFDTFIIEQGVNPALRLRGLYKPGPHLSLYTEAWYMPAGLLNLSMNHFGFNFKTGISWNF